VYGKLKSGAECYVVLSGPSVGIVSMCFPK